MCNRIKKKKQILRPFCASFLSGLVCERCQLLKAATGFWSEIVMVIKECFFLFMQPVCASVAAEMSWSPLTEFTHIWVCPLKRGTERREEKKKTQRLKKFPSRKSFQGKGGGVWCCDKAGRESRSWWRREETGINSVMFHTRPHKHGAGLVGRQPVPSVSSHFLHLYVPLIRCHGCRLDFHECAAHSQSKRRKLDGDNSSILVVGYKPDLQKKNYVMQEFSFQQVAGLNCRKIGSIDIYEN